MNLNPKLSQKQKSLGSQKNKTRINTPFVIGAVIELGNCLNLLEPGSIDIVKNAHARFTEACKNSAKPIPVNKGAIRKLDCSVIKYVHQSTENKGLPAYD